MDAREPVLNGVHWDEGYTHGREWANGLRSSPWHTGVGAVFSLDPNSPTAEAASVAGKGTPASPKKTLPQREAELRTMLATAEGRADLEALAARYAAHGGGVRHGSVVTYILVHERTRGLIG
jgi:hypothetical protein